MYEQIASGVIAGLITVLAGYGMVRLTIKSVQKQVFSDIFSKDNFDLLLNMAINDEKFQKFLFEAGGLVGNGAKAGFGLQSSGRKGNIQDLLMQLVGGYVQNKLPGALSGITGQEQSSNTQTGKVGY